MDATRAASPSELFRLSRMVWNWPPSTARIRVPKLVTAYCPAMSLKIAPRCTLPIPAVFLLMSFRMSSMSRMLPLASLVWTPSLATALDVPRRVSTERIEVPAMLPWTPALPSRAVAVVTVSRLWPYSRPTPAEYFSESPSMRISTLFRVNAAVSTSAT